MATTVLKLGGELLEDAAAMRTAADGDRASRVSDAARGRPRRRPRDRRRAAGARQGADASWTACASPTSGARRRGLGAGGAHQHRVGRGDRRRRRTRRRPDRRGRAIGLSTRTGTFTTVSGQTVDLGLVGSARWHATRRCWPTCFGSATSRSSRASASTREGALLNVNADTLAAHLAAAASGGPADHRRRDGWRARRCRSA